MSDPHTLRIPATTITQLRDALLRADDKERFAYGYASSSADDSVLLLTEIVPVPDGAMAHQSTHRCRPGPAVEREQLAACTRRDLHPVLIHSHPFTDTATFSTADKRMMARYQQWLHPLYPERHVVFGVLGRESLRARALPAPRSSERERETVPPVGHRLQVSVPGDWMLDPPLHTAVPAVDETDRVFLDEERYDRQLRAFMAAGQSRLSQAHIAVIGCGGLGSFLATQLARLGVGKLTLVDPDDIERSNLPRLVGATDGDVGTAKVRYLQQQCFQANPAATVTTCYQRVEETGEQLQHADLLIGGVDQVHPRLWLNQFAVQQCLPYLDAGVRIDTEPRTATTVTDAGQPGAGIDEAVIDDVLDAETDADTADARQVTGMTGYMQTVAPGATACFDCLNRGDPETARREQLSAEELREYRSRDYIDDIESSPAPAVIHLNGVVASLTINAAVKLLTHHAAPTGLLRYDALQPDLTALQTRPRSSCPTCGANGVLAAGTLTAASLPDALDLEPWEAAETDAH